LLHTLAYAADENASTVASTTFSSPSWILILGISFGIGFGIAALAYMLSTAFRLPELLSWAKNEFAEMVGTAMIVAIVLIALAFGDSMFVVAFGGTPMQMSKTFISSVSDKLFTVTEKAMNVNILLSVISGPPPQYAGSSSPDTIAGQLKSKLRDIKGSGAVKYEGFMSVIMFMATSAIDVSFFSSQSLNVLFGEFQTLQSTALLALSINLLLDTILNFINMFAIPVCLPLGVLLSSFAMSRKLGRTMIALGVVLYFFFPVSIVLTQRMYDSTYKPGKSPGEIAAPSTYDSIEYILKGEAMSKVGGFALDIILLEPLTIGPAVDVATALPHCVFGSAFQTLINYVRCTPRCVPSIGSGALQCISTCSEESVWQGCLTSCATAGPGYFACLLACTGGCGPQAAINNAFSKWPKEVVKEYSTWSGATNAMTYLPILTSGQAEFSGIAGYTKLMLDLLVGFAPGMSGLSSLRASYHMDRVLGDKITTAMGEFIPYAAQYVIPVILMLPIIAIVCITALRSISPAIGGELQILGITDII
jgi:hypothetical protein